LRNQLQVKTVFVVYFSSPSYNQNEHLSLQEAFMRIHNFTWKDIDGVDLFVYEWHPDEHTRVKGIVQISHGMAETAARYERLALALTTQGYIVYANDHRGHGRTAESPERLGILGQDGFHRMVANMAELTDRIRARHKELPIFLLGHSMGSFLTQQYMVQFADKIKGVILSGSNGLQNPMLGIAIWIASVQAKLQGENHRSNLLNLLTFGSYNKAFRPNRSPFDWLSRDPYCGVIFTASFFRDFFKGLKEIHLPEQMAKIPKNLPIYVFSGEKDPVGAMGKGVRKLLKMYCELGLKQVSSTLYPEGRHEMLNELNHDEVTKDLIDWLQLVNG
jgi:alpha-beta hydrolase superfamily lysophospholipase